MATHEVKIWDYTFREIKQNKLSEWTEHRKNDVNFQKDDNIILVEIDRETDKATGNRLSAKITNLIELKNPMFDGHNYVCIRMCIEHVKLPFNSRKFITEIEDLLLTKAGEPNYIRMYSNICGSVIIERKEFTSSYIIRVLKAIEDFKDTSIRIEPSYHRAKENQNVELIIGTL